MFPEERREKIGEFIKAASRTTTSAVARKFRASLPTIRRDMAVLKAAGLIKRTYGGAMAVAASIDLLSFEKRLQSFAREKERIAEYAVSLIETGNTIILDSGTTTYMMSSLIKRMGLKDFSVITNSLKVALELAPYPPVKCTLLGGTLKYKTLAFVGPLTIDNLKSFRVDKLFLGTSGLHSNKGLSEIDEEEMWVKRKFLETARQKIVLTDHSKIGQTTFARVCGIAAIDMIITDSEIAPRLKKELQRKAKKVVFV